MGIPIDGDGFLKPVIRKGDLCYFDEGEYYTLRKMNEGILKKFDKKSITQKFWDDLKKEGWGDPFSFENLYGRRGK